MATIKQRMWRKNASGTYDTIHLETESGLVLRPSGRTVEQDLTDYLPKTQDSDTPPKTLKSGLLLTCGNYPYLGIQTLPVRLAKYTEVPNLNDYYNKSYIDDLEDELRGLINDNKPVELLYSQNGLSYSSPEEPIVTFDTPMSYITVNAYILYIENKETGEQTLTPGATFNGFIADASSISISLSSDGLSVTARISNSQLQGRTRFDIKGYGRRQ